MKCWIGVAVSIMVAVGLAGAMLCYYEPVSIMPVLQKEAGIEVTSLYRDACVYSVTHPELEIALDRVESPGNGCTLCQYWFRIWNQTAAVGTKAYQTRVLVVPQGQNVILNGRSIQTLKLYGLVTELPAIEYTEIRNQDYFVLEAPCPDCLFPNQRYITFIVEYYECDGIRRFKVVCDLTSKQVTVLESAFELTETNCCK